MYTHRGAYLNALAEMHHARLDSSLRLPVDAADVPLQRLVLPLGRDRGRRDARLPAGRSTPAAIWRLIGEERVTHFSGAPTVLMMLGHRPGGAAGRPRRSR